MNTCNPFVIKDDEGDEESSLFSPNGTNESGLLLLLLLLFVMVDDGQGTEEDVDVDGPADAEDDEDAGG